MISLEELQQLYDDNRFLEAFRRTSDYWKPSTRLEDLSIDELILAGRLASRLGGGRLSRRIFREAWRREPEHPRVRYYCSHARRRNFELFDEMRAFEKNPELAGADAETQSSWFAFHAVRWALLRDFTRAHRCIEKAASLQVRDGWVLSCESDVYAYEDRREDALRCAERSWEIKAGTPYAAHSVAACLLHLGRVGEAAARTSAAAENCESFEVVHLAAWYLCALAETQGGSERLRTLERARQFADRLPAMAPLADRETHSLFARTHLDIAQLSDDHAAMERWAGQARSPFHRRVLENIRANPEGARIRLPFRRGLQRHDECLPTSIGSALAAMGVEIDADAMATDLTFGGTAEWAAADWLEKRGLIVRFFAATPEVCTALIRNGIAFEVTLEADASAHAVAAVGLDEAAGTLLIHDPNGFRSSEYLLESIGKGLAPLGPKGMATVPAEKAALLDQLLPRADADAMLAVHLYSKARFWRDDAQGRAVVRDLAGRHPDHPITRLLESGVALNDGHASQAMLLLQELLRTFPASALVRSDLIASCRSLGNTALMRETLAGVVESGILPGIQSQQQWRHPPSAYVGEYADLLRLSSETRDQARSLLNAALRREPNCAQVWHILGDLLWQERDFEGALLGYRLGACLAPAFEHYASAYADALIAAGREDEGLQWLEERTRRFRTSTQAVSTWTTWIAALESSGRPAQALAACDEALQLHGDSPILLEFAVPFQARMGRWEEAEKLLLRMEKHANSGLFHAAAVSFHSMRGNLEESIRHAEEWLREAPLSMRARQELLDLVARAEGPQAAANRAAQWVAQNPGHDQIEELYCRQLDRAGAPSSRKLRVILRRLKRNREDGWAWRERAFSSIYDCQAAEGRRRARRERSIPQIIAECDRTSGEDVSTLRAHALWSETQARWREAVDGWLKAVELDPSYMYSYRRAWDCAARLDPAERIQIWERMDAAFVASTGDLSIAREIIMMVAQRFGVGVAEQAATRWMQTRPHHPQIIEASVDLLLEYGHGQTDFRRALETLQPAVEQFPYSSGLRFSLADALRKLGRFEEAEQVLAEIIRRHPGNSGARTQMALVHEGHGRIEEALEGLSAAARLNPFAAELADTRAGILIRARRYDEARTVIDEGLRKFPANVSWRDRAIRLLRDCGDYQAAVEAARQGVVVYPRGAWLWLVLARTLNELRHFAAQGEIEFCLRRSLALNRELYDAADLLSVLLAEQSRYDEAAKLMQETAERLDDPLPARSRIAWIHREQGLKAKAVEEMISVLKVSPWNRWGWSVLMDWLTEDKSWGTARDVLRVTPPELLTWTDSRRRRLNLLQKAGLAAEELDAEWNSLLHDFPEDVPLHLHRYDSLLEDRRRPEGAALLRKIEPVDPDNPYMLARMVEVLAECPPEEGAPPDPEKNAAVAALLKVFFREVEETPWLANYSWEAAQRSHLEEQVYRKARNRLQRGLRPTPTALGILAACAAQRYGAREMLALLKMINAAPWQQGRYRAIVLNQLSRAGYKKRVARYWRRHRAEVESDTGSWSVTAAALVDLKRLSAARRLLADWRNRPGVEMWMVANYVMACSSLRAGQLREVRSACEDALSGLPHDHCARYLAHRQAEACALLGDRQGLRKTWDTWRKYFDSNPENHEWFEGKRRYLMAEVPMMVRLLEENKSSLYRSTVRGLRWKRWFSPNNAQPAQTKSGNPNWWWIAWITFILLSQLVRLLDSGSK